MERRNFITTALAAAAITAVPMFAHDNRDGTLRKFERRSDRLTTIDESDPFWKRIDHIWERVEWEDLEIGDVMRVCDRGYPPSQAMRIQGYGTPDAFWVVPV